MSTLVGGTGIIGQDMVCGFSNGKYKTFEGTEISIENCVKDRIKDLRVEGKTIQDTEDLSNIESVAEKEGNVLSIVNKGKNLFNIHEWYGSCIWYNITNEEIIYLLSSSASVNVYLSKTNKLSKGVYRISLQGEGENVAYSRIEVYSVIDDISTKIADTNINTKLYNSLSFTLDEDTYIKFKFFVVNSDNTVKEGYKLKNIQLEEGTVATSYEPYREPVATNINLPIPLRSLPNGACDTIEGDKLIQRVGKITVTKQEDATKLGRTSNIYGHRLYYINSDIYGEKGKCNNTEIGVISNKFIGIADCEWNYSKKVNCCFMNINGVVHFLVDETEFPNIENFNDWLGENEVIVYYELKTPIIHSLEIPQLSTTKGTNIITTENNIKPKISMKVKVK